MRKLLFLLFISSTYLLSNTKNNLQTIQKSTFIDTKKEIITIPTEEELEKKSKKIIKQLLKTKNPSRLSRSLTKKYYKNHNYKPFFVTLDGVKAISFDLIEIVKNDQVLKPKINELFNLNKIENQMFLANENMKELIKLDFMLVSLYHRYMRFLSKGSIDWKSFQKHLKNLDEKKEIQANWKKYSVRKVSRLLLYNAVKENNINLAIKQANYTFPKANELSNLIKEYEQLSQNGGYVKIPSIKKALKKGNYYPEIKLLRQRLIQSNDLLETDCQFSENENNINENTSEIQEVIIDKNTASINQSSNKVDMIKDCKELFDQNVYEAVKSFQKSHGLIADGIVGRNTIKRLNISIESKIQKMRINLERMRWMPRTLGEKYVMVNIPDYNLKMFNNGEKTLEMPVVVGEKKHPTPVFSHKISTVVLNPYWRIPQRIVRREIIPKLVEDSTYLQRNEIKTFENWSHKSTEYDTSDIDWSIFLGNDLIGNTAEAPMRFIQIPGKKNPLGRMKFLFPNKYSVYLHDTPHKRLFKNSRRAYSHGCIRLARPQDLLKAITEENTKMTFNEAKEVLLDIEKTDIDLTKKIPVHIIYLTSWIDEEGKIQFRDDIYRYDKIQERLIYN